MKTVQYKGWLLAFLVAMLPGMYGCSDVRGAPPAPETTTALQQASDSTAVLTAAWSEVEPPADVWRWRLVQGDAAGETEATEVSSVIERRDSLYTETVCVHGVAVRGSEQVEGEEGCASVEVPPTPLQTPGTPQPDASVDTSTESASVPNMPSSVEVAEVSQTDSTVTYQASWDCVENAESYVVTAGSNSGRWSYTDTLPASVCDSETAMREAVLAFREKAKAHRECVAAGLCR